MARKNILAGLIAPQLPSGNSGGEALPDKGLEADRAPRSGPSGSRGAIGAVTRSIESLKSAAWEAEEMRARLEAGQTVVEIDPAAIDPSPVADRIPDAAADLSEFVEAIRASGQQVPILVRPHPGEPGRYQTAYGHRRVRAARELGRTVRAVVRTMSDAELVVAQGQENSARRDLSFIERALYAARLEEAGFERDTVMTALNVDKTGLSRLISVAVKVPRDVIQGIGPAPKVGRDRWLDLVGKLEERGTLEEVRSAMGAETFAGASTDERFEIVLRAAHARRAKPRASAAKTPRRLDDGAGQTVGTVERVGKGARLTLASAAFADFLAARMPRLHAEWRAAAEPETRMEERETK